MGLTFFIAAPLVLCSEFVAKTALITQQRFGCCWTVLAQPQGFLSLPLCSANKGKNKSSGRFNYFWQITSKWDPPKPFVDPPVPLSSLTICSFSACYFSHQGDLGLSIGLPGGEVAQRPVGVFLVPCSFSPVLPHHTPQYFFIQNRFIPLSHLETLLGTPVSNN